MQSIQLLLVHELETGSDDVLKLSPFVRTELGLIHADVSPSLASLLAHRTTPLGDRRFLRCGVWPDAPLGLDNPGDFGSVFHFLDDDPIRVIEAHGPAWLQVVHAESGTTVLLCRAERRKSRNVLASLV